MDTKAPLVRLEVADGIGTIRLDRPPMNALNIQLQDELREVAAQVSADDSVRAVVVYGGETVFAAGAQITRYRYDTLQFAFNILTRSRA